MDKLYLQRCLDIAANGRGKAAPNPLVGAVIVHDGKIIGEGWHRAYGGPHAEVNAVESVDDKTLLPASTIYVSLEPCHHHGKTPPCVELLIHHQFKRVVVACLDPNPKVAGKSMRALKAAGIETQLGPMTREARQLNAPFMTYHEKKRPYILLKWAETADKLIGGPNGAQVAISGALANRLVHQWRTESQAILVGRNTAVLDNPSLTARYGFETGRQPIRLFLDKMGKVPHSHNLLDGTVETVVYTETPDHFPATVSKAPAPGNLSALMEDLYGRGIQSVLVEGGAQLLNSFLKAGLWDEARVLQSDRTIAELQDGPANPAECPNAPVISGRIDQVTKLGVDQLVIYRPAQVSSLVL